MVKQFSIKAFRRLIIAQAVLLILGILSAFIVPLFANKETLALYDSVLALPISGLDMFLYVILLPVLVWAIFNLFALYRFAPYAPKHLFYITTLGIGLGFFVAPFSLSAYFNIESMFYYIGSILSGVTLALVYYSNIALEFTPKDTPVSASQVGATE
ncbi:MAG: hypothetical protein RLZZ70_327 [Candidatus Parcubacteria bacterium]|jgi:hypothetical protein